MPMGVYPRPLRFCDIPGCGRKHEGRGLCRRHWAVAWNQQDPGKRKAIRARYWIKNKAKLIDKQRVMRRRYKYVAHPMVEYFQTFITGRKP